MSFYQILQKWQLDAVLKKYPDLHIRPDNQTGLLLAGRLRFNATVLNHEAIADEYSVSIAAPINFPKEAPIVKDVGNRIQPDYHTNKHDNSLCLGSPARVLLKINEDPTLLGFIDNCVIPFLYGYSYFEKYGKPPFGELAHGNEGALEDYADLFDLASKEDCIEMLLLASLKKRVANKYLCPCYSGRRLGKCHNQIINDLREKLGRRWCAEEAVRLLRT